MSTPTAPRISFPQVRLPECDCSACGAPTLRSFYADDDVVLLAQCDTCAFIANVAARRSAIDIESGRTLDFVRDPRALLGTLAPVTAESSVVLSVQDATPLLNCGDYQAIDPERHGYFTPASLSRFVQRAGLEVRDLVVADGNIIVEAGPEPAGGQKRDMPTLTELRGATHFARMVRRRLTQPTL